MPPKNTEALEEKYTKFLNTIYEKLLDLNVPMSKVAEQCMTLMNQREELLSAYGVVTVPVIAPPAAAKGGSGAPAAVKGNIAGQYRMKLMECLTKKAGTTPITKDDLTFVTEAADETEKEWVSTVSSPHLAKKYKSAAPQVSKKAAEQAAAQAAVLAEFPDVYHQMAALGEAPKGQKRKLADEGEVTFPDSKSKMSHVMSLLLGRSMKAGDIAYTTVEADGSYVATLSLPNLKGGKTYKGAAGASKKDAESNAAEAALKALDSLIRPAMEEHKAKKLKKRAEAIAKLDEKMAARRAAEGTA